MPALLYRPDQIEAQLEYVTRAARQLASTGSKVLVLGPSSHHPGYDTPVDMTADEWTVFLANLRRLEGVVNEAGLEDRAPSALGPGDRDRQGHRSAAGVIRRRVVPRHRPRLPGRHRSGRGRARGARSRPPRPPQGPRPGQGRAGAERRGPFRESVIDGLFVPLGQGGVDIAGVIAALEADGYRGWYVLEQDVSLKGEPPVGEGPKADAVDSVAYLRALAAGRRVSQPALRDLEATCVLPAAAQLGECPTWSPTRPGCTGSTSTGGRSTASTRRRAWTSGVPHRAVRGRWRSRPHRTAARRAGGSPRVPRLVVGGVARRVCSSRRAGNRLNDGRATRPGGSGSARCSIRRRPARRPGSSIGSSRTARR